MDSRKIMLLVGALIVAAITAFMARSLMSGAPAPVANALPTAVAPVSGTQVLVATRALPVGTLLDPTMMRFQPWPRELIEGAYYLKDSVDPKSLQGTVVRFAIPAGQPLTQGSLVKPGDRGFLAAALGAGMRAVTVPVVGSNTNVAGFVFPGDRVDLILTQSVSGGGDGPPLEASETVLRNLRVLATDQKTDKTTDDKGNTVVTNYSNVTVEATPRIAEKIAVAQKIGSISLSLRSIADNQSELEQAIASGEVTVPDGDDPKAERSMLASATPGPVEGDATVSTGADVSRFQRRTVPGKPSDQIPTGPVVRVARGNNVTDVAFGGKN